MVGSMSFFCLSSLVSFWCIPMGSGVFEFGRLLVVPTDVENVDINADASNGQRFAFELEKVVTLDAM